MSSNISGGASGKDWGAVLDPNMDSDGMGHEIGHPAGYGTDAYPSPDPYKGGTHPKVPDDE